MRLRDEARSNLVTAARCLLAARGVAPDNERALAGAMIEAEFQLSVITFIQGAGQKT